MSAPKVLIQTQFVPCNVRGLGKKDNGGIDSPRDLERFMDSTLSQRLSAIPKDQDSTVLTSVSVDHSIRSKRNPLIVENIE